MSDEHPVELTIRGSIDEATMTCNAPPDAMCHARYDCECEAWIDAGVTDGLPTHRVGDGDRESWHDETRCVGRFDPDWCNYVEWFHDGNGHEEMYGALHVSVVPEWQGEFYRFRIVEKP